MSSWCQALADKFYAELGSGVLDISEIVQALREEWKEENNVEMVHHGASEVASCFMRNDGVVWGDRKSGDFIPWKLEGWDAEDRIEKELSEMDRFAEGPEVGSFKLRKENKLVGQIASS